MFRDLSLKIYKENNPKALKISDEKIIETPLYKKIYDLVENIYYKTIVITLYFNGYRQN